MQTKRLTDLFHKYFEKTATEAERDEFFTLLQREATEEEIHALIAGAYQEFEPEVSPFTQGDKERMMREIVAKAGEGKIVALKTKNKVFPVRWIAAAVVLLIAGAALFYFKTAAPGNISSMAGADIAPGRQSATLTLANGKRILLSDAVNGNLAEEAGVQISKTSDGQVVYEIKNQSLNSETYNTLSTGNGEQYQIKLPDGTMVWLNAASKLKYPVAFSTQERRVELQGEAYFEVQHNPQKPFKVVSEDQEVKVLGTHFNISSYENEIAMKTTLLEGSIQVVHGKERPRVLKPGQQLIVREGNSKLINVQTDDVVAWKNGYFMFNNESLEDIMAKVARWYDVEVKYANASSRKITFFGTVSRFSNISEVLKKLELTDEVRFELKNKQLTVIKK